MSGRRNGHEPKRDPEDQELHGANVSRRRRAPEDDEAPEALKYMADPADAVEAPVDGLEWLNSKSTSTSKFTPEDTESREWVIEYDIMLAKQPYPTEEGLSGHLRAWAADDAEAAEDPLSTAEILQIEAAAETGKEASTRAREGWASETALSDTRESIVRNPDDDRGGSNRGGLMSRLRS